MFLVRACEFRSECQRVGCWVSPLHFLAATRGAGGLSISDLNFLPVQSYAR